MSRLLTILPAYPLMSNGLCATQFCPPLGAVLPAPRSVSSDSDVALAVANLLATLDLSTQGEGSQEISLAPNVTSFSVNLASIHNEGYVLEYHHTASVRNDSLGGTTNVTGDAVYRIASISEVVTVLVLLLQDGRINLDEPVTTYVPELAAIAAEQTRRRQADGRVRGVEEIRWGEITSRALMSHLSGLSRIVRLYYTRVIL